MIIKSADFIASYGQPGQLPHPQRPEIVFSGHSNVGKSSLINKLCCRKKLAKVSATPGKTATINFFDVNGDLYFVDLPGYGYAKTSHAERERWDGLIHAYFGQQRIVPLVIQLLDSRHDPSAEDTQMLRFLHFHKVPYVVALTKCDKLKAREAAEALEDFQAALEPLGCRKVFLTSAEKGTGIPELLAEMESAIEACHGVS